MWIEWTRRRFLQRTVPAAALASAQWPALAQVPHESARVLVGYPAGGTLDVISRALAERLKGRWARTVLVENRPGAAGRLAVDALKAAPADGSVLLITPASVLTMYPHIYKTLSYDVFADIAPVSICAVSGFVLVIGPAVPATVHTLDAFVDWCEAHPAAAQCGNAGAGSLPHFMAMLLADELHVPLGHVPYKGGLAAMQAAAGGEVAAAIATEGASLALAQAGKLRVLASSNLQRSTHLPQTPTFNELGRQRLSQREWFAAFMPARTPMAVIETVAGSIAAALREAEVREVWQRLALAPDSSTPAELKRALRTEHDFWGPIVRASGFTPEA